MVKIVNRTSLFDLVDAMDMNNDCLKLLVSTLESNETETPQGFQTLLCSVVGTYEELYKNLEAMSKT